MKQKGIIIFLLVSITSISLYYLSFTYKSFKINQEANEFSKDEHGNIDYEKKQKFFESIWKQKIYRPVLFNYTYEEVKERELTQGLDLQGGMNVTLEISPSDLIYTLSGESKDKNFKTVLDNLKNKYGELTKEEFLDKFYDEYKQLDSNIKLSSIFAKYSNRAKINYNSTNKQVLDYLSKEIDDSLDRSLHILRTRLDKFGTTNINIQKLASSGRIQIELPGVRNPTRVKKLLKNVAKLTFWELYDSDQIKDYFISINNYIIEEKRQKAGNDINRKIFKSPFQTRHEDNFYTKEEKDAAQKDLKRPEILNMFPKNLKFAWSVKPRIKENDQVYKLYFLKIMTGGKPLLDGEVITNAESDFRSGAYPSVSMQMNTKGAKLWKKITSQNIGKQIAIVLDDAVYSAPVVQSEIPNGISSISGDFTLEEAKDLANILKAGSLPAPIKIVEEAIIGPTLGKKAQMQGMISMGLGLLLVIIFMACYYSGAGLVANLALVLNMIFILGTLAQLHASLTLPGIAGIVLTIGMSIDANVLIFERIREEIKHGLSIKNAISIGYQKAYTSIIDSNLTTFFTGVILYFFGQGPIKGFATTMMIGIISSFFSAVFITRLVFETLTKNPKRKLSFSFKFSDNILKNFNINFIKIRKYSYSISVFIISIGLLLIISQKGLNMGVDFTGGRSYIISFPKNIDPTILKTNLSSNSFNNQSTEVKTYGSSNTLKITTSYMMKSSDPDADKIVENALIKGIENFTNLKYSNQHNIKDENSFSINSTSKVGATVAKDITASSKKSIFLSLLVIFLYIFARFRRWQFGVSSVIALFHDSLIVFASFAISRAFGFAFEIDQVFIGAILTVIGYSINDTVVVFDRIRENMLSLKNTEFFSLANKSINETMSRTLITSFTTFIAVFILFAFGGEVLRGFSFAMLIGIIFGTYSSICIATPLVVDLTNLFSKKDKKQIKG